MTKHFNGIKTRLRLMKALMFMRTSGWVGTATDELEKQDAHYLGVFGNLNPIEFFKLIRPFIKRSFKDLPDYSILNHFDYLRNNKELNPIWSAEPDVSMFVANLAFLLDAQTVLETGSFVGATTTHIAYALHSLGGKRNLYFVDVEQKFLDMTLNNVSELQCNDVILHPVCGSSLDRITQSHLPSRFDLIFLDSEHVENGLWQEMQIFLPMLSDTGILLVHDSIRWPGVRRCILRLQHTHHILNYATSNRNGVAAIISIKNNNSKKSFLK